ncbi:MAG: alpha/beta fold hydrolase [Planctomycetes bacterium]|nr:alpha/beta fold hydrolase [Planctomycetota bacterium]
MFPRFQPHLLIRGGHAQTLAGALAPGWCPVYRASRHTVQLDDGDAIVLHDDRPSGWQTGDPVVLLMHGLAGCHLSPYMIRLAAKLNDVGVRAFRMDHRGCGAGHSLARLPYNAGRSEDALSAIHKIIRLCPRSKLGVVGFSLSGNLTLKLLGERPEMIPPEVVCAAAINPPIDLAACMQGLLRPANRLYDLRFVRILDRNLIARKKQMPEIPLAGYQGPSRRLLDLDDAYTAPLSGYVDAQHYYARCSSEQFVGDIRTSTLILAARDDPLIPVESFERLSLPRAVKLHIARSGGHLGYVARAGQDADRRWMDWRILEWLTSHWGGKSARSDAMPHGSYGRAKRQPKLDRSNY